MITGRQGVSKDKRARRTLQCAVASGLAGALVAAGSLNGVGTAHATCVGISGINIGQGCNSSLGNFALVLGTGTADASGGFFNAALGAGTDVMAKAAVGALNLAVAGGTNTSAQAGVGGLDFVNIAFNAGSADAAPGSAGTAKSTVEAGNGAFNLAGNLLGNADSGTPLFVRAGGNDNSLGFGTVAANVMGDRSHVETTGSLANATNWGNIFTSPHSSDSTVIAGTSVSPAFLSWAFNYQGTFTEDCPTGPCGNTVTANGPLSLVGAVGVVKQNVNGGVGITLAGDRAGLQFEDAIKNTYVAIEPWVHYGFQIAQYAVGWIPWVGWLAPQIDIFYHFGERIVRSLVFNSADWLWGPLPFGVGLANVARDSWNSLVQLGKDQWNFWLPPLPPLPPGTQLAATPTASPTTGQQQPGTAPAQILQSLRERLALREPSFRHTTGAAAATVPGLIAQTEKSFGRGGPKVSSIRTALTKAAEDVTETLPPRRPSASQSAKDLNPTNTETLKEVHQAPHKAADQATAQSVTASATRSAAQRHPGRDHGVA